MKWLRRLIVNRSTWYYTILSCIFGLLLCGEFLCYLSTACKWYSLPKSNDTTTIRLMLVSDPQILGYKNEPLFPIGLITRWDADRYLSKTFYLAVKHIKPEMIIFLGDLMDEGSIATDNHYTRYAKRFFKIFSSEKTFQVFVPGDNDIGGEGLDTVTTDKIRRFKQHFFDSDHVVFKFAEFSRVNFFTHELEVMDDDKNKTRILFTHHPIIPTKSDFRSEVIRKAKPHLIFAGHDHWSSLYTADLNGNIITQEYLFDDRIWAFNMSEKIHEILVPTCSYRMGTRNIGYGAALIDQNKMIYYTILWTPDRYWFLNLYLYLICPVGLFFVMILIKRFIARVFCR